MANLALFDLDHTLIPTDSDHEWGRFTLLFGQIAVRLKGVSTRRSNR